MLRRPSRDLAKTEKDESGEERMPARTGEQFLRGLVDDREIWVGSDKVSSPVDHPSLRGAALALAEVFDLQHREAGASLMPDPETGELINVSHMIPARARTCSVGIAGSNASPNIRSG
jgi:hypothetical protein